MRNILNTLVQRRDERQEGFERVIRKAMHERLGKDADEAMKALNRDVPVGERVDA